MRTLNQENIITADAFQKDRAYFPITEFLNIYYTLFGSESFTDLSGKCLRAGARENLC